MDWLDWTHWITGKWIPILLDWFIVDESDLKKHEIPYDMLEEHLYEPGQLFRESVETEIDGTRTIVREEVLLDLLEDTLNVTPVLPSTPQKKKNLVTSKRMTLDEFIREEQGGFMTGPLFKGTFTFKGRQYE